MKKFTGQLQSKAKTVKLKTAEQRVLRDRVISYMEYHPLPVGESNDVIQKPRQAAKQPFYESYRVFTFPSYKRNRVVQFGMAFSLLLFVTTPVMAERAVPGDILYRVKTQINEPVRSTLAFSTHQKVEWETELVNRRLAEARILVSEGKLTPEVETEIATALKTHTENAAKEIAVLREQDAEEAALAQIAFTTTLEVQSAALRDSEVMAPSSGGVARLETVINETLSQNVSEETEATILSPEKLMARVEINTTRVYELLDSLTLDTQSTLYKDIQRRVQDVERTVAEAMQAGGGGNTAVVSMLVDSLERSQKLIVLLSEIQTRQAIEVEKYVPVVLTPEERQNYIDQAETMIARQQVFISSNLSAINDPETAAKLQSALLTMEDLKNTLNTTEAFTDKQVLYEEIMMVGRDAIEIYSGFEIRFDPNETASSTPIVLPVATSSEESVEVEDTVATSTEEII